MRLSSLSSVAIAPVLVALVASGAHAASPSPSGVKRVAKRAAAPAYVLPAPTPKEEPLPPLPPPPPSSSSSSASAPLPPPFPPVQTTTPADADLPAASVGSTKEVKPTGAVLQFGSGVLVPASSFLPGLSTIGPGMAFDLRVGAYATPHLGIVAGFRGSYGHKMGGCGEGCAKGYSLQVPIMLQFAQKDRARGLYGELGLGFATTYGGSGDGYTYSVSSPVELKLGMGYRLSGANDTRSSLTLDLNFGMDIGKVDKAKLTTGAARYEGSVDNASTHLVVALSLISHFSL